MDGSLGQKRNDKRKDRVHVSEWKSLGSVKRQCALLPQVTNFKYKGSAVKADGDLNAELKYTTRCGWNNSVNLSGVLGDKKIPPHGKETIDTMIVQPGMLYEMETVPMSSSRVKKLYVIEMKMCIWACGHILIEHVSNYNTR